MKQDRNISEKYKYGKKMNRLLLTIAISGIFCFASVVCDVVLGIVCKMDFWSIFLAYSIAIKCCFVANNNLFHLIDEHKRKHLEEVEKDYNCFDLTKEEITFLQSTQTNIKTNLKIKKQNEIVNEELLEQQNSL